MNTELYKKYCRNGHGRAVTVLMDAPDKELYREAVFEMAVTDYRLDRQTEASRGGYILDLVNCFSDSEAFLDRIFEHYGSVPADDDNIGYYFSNLKEMCRKVSRSERVIYKLYNKVFEHLITGKGTDRDPKSENYFEYFTYDAAVHYLIEANPAYAERIVTDLYKLYLSEMYPEYNIGSCTECIETLMGKSNFNALLLRMERDIPGIGKIHEIYKSTSGENVRVVPRNQRMLSDCKIESAEDLFEYYRTEKKRLPYSHSFWNKMTVDDTKKLADVILYGENDVVRRLTVLDLGRIWGGYPGRVPKIPPFPYDASFLIDMINSIGNLEPNEYVVYVQLARILGGIKSKSAFEFAKESIKNYDHDGEFDKNSVINCFSVISIITNFEPYCTGLLLETAKKIKEPSRLDSFAFDFAHYFFEVIEDADDDMVLFMNYLYEELACSNCRAAIVRNMKRLGVITESIRREANYDVIKQNL